MITEILISILVFIFKIIVFILPNWTYPAVITTPIYDMFDFFLGFEILLPVSTAFECLFYILNLLFLLFMVKLVFGAISIARGGGSMNI